MSALDEVREAIERTIRLAEREIGQPMTPAAKRYARAERMRLKVGRSAARGIIAELHREFGNEELPGMIDDVPVVRTDEFDGFELVVL
jgi:hypothetical protein